MGIQIPMIKTTSAGQDVVVLYDKHVSLSSSGPLDWSSHPFGVTQREEIPMYMKTSTYPTKTSS